MTDAKAKMRRRSRRKINRQKWFDRHGGDWVYEHDLAVFLILQSIVVLGIATMMFLAILILAP